MHIAIFSSNETSEKKFYRLLRYLCEFQLFLSVFFLLVFYSPTRVLQPFPENTTTANLGSTAISVIGDPLRGVGTEVANPYSPQVGDNKFSRSNAFLDSSLIIIMESFPVQIGVYLQGSLPTPCHQQRIIVSPPDTEKPILIEVCSIFDHDNNCVQMLQSYEANAPLGSLPTGNYSIWIAGSQIGEFDS